MPSAICLLSLVAFACIVASFWRPEPLLKVGALLLSIVELIRGCIPLQ
jgi:hypothetical protein